MYIAVISDLHLNPRRIDNRVVSYLKKIYSNNKIGRVIINGDLVELIGPPWFRHHARFEKFYKVWGNTLRPIFNTKPTSLIFGNHDKEIFYPPSLQNLISHTSNFEKLSINNHSILVTHGHQYVLKGDIVYPLGQAIGLVVKFLYLTLGFAKTNQLLGQRYNRQAQSHVAPRSSLVMGHTHFFELNPFARFYNSGCNLAGHHQGLAIHGTTGKILSLQEIL